MITSSNNNNLRTCLPQAGNERMRKLRNTWPSFYFHLLVFAAISSFQLYFLPAVSAQSTEKEKEILAMSAGFGVLTFHGDVGKSSLVGSYSYIRSGISFSVEKTLNRNLVLSLSLLKG